MTANQDKEVLQEDRRSPRVMEKCMWHLIREKLSYSIVTILGHFALGSANLKVQSIGSSMTTMRENPIHALMAFTVNNEVSMCSKLCLDSYNALKAKYDELQSEFGDQEAALTAHKIDSMNYIPVSLQNQANPAGSKEVIDIDVQTEEAEELLVVSSTSRKAAVSEHNGYKEESLSKIPSSSSNLQVCWMTLWTLEKSLMHLLLRAILVNQYLQKPLPVLFLLIQYPW
ncbi:hypothetical protein Tco_0821859 [Tanacetum coccineum]|uniref:Uncharacterized protein n=1 Tax=Tanacetum coccineum TaxID=301880 RepID=A0ABQ5ADH3_9ASTR